MSSTARPAPGTPQEVASISCLPPEIQATILLHVDSAADVRSFKQTSKGMHLLALDPHLTAQWLLTHRPNQAMFLAAQRMRSTNIFLQLLHLGASPTADSGSSYSTCTNTPLELAARYNHPKVVSVLLQNHDVQANASSAAEALYCAAASGSAESLKALLVPHSPVHANSRVYSGYFSLFTALHEAVSVYLENWSAFRAAKTLIDHGASCIALDSYGRLPLHKASACGSVMLVRLLLEAPEGLSVLCSRDAKGETPLHKACSSKHCAPGDQVDTVRALLGAPGGLDVLDAADNEGRTPLRLAAESAPDCCEVLLRAGSKAIHIPDNMGRTPVDVSHGGAKRLMLRWK